MKIILSSYFLLIFLSYYSQKQDFDMYRNFYGAKSITHLIYDFSKDSTLKLTKYASVYEFDKLGNLVLKKSIYPSSINFSKNQEISYQQYETKNLDSLFNERSLNKLSSKKYYFQKVNAGSITTFYLYKPKIEFIRINSIKINENQVNSIRVTKDLRSGNIDTIMIEYKKISENKFVEKILKHKQLQSNITYKSSVAGFIDVIKDSIIPIEKPWIQDDAESTMNPKVYIYKLNAKKQIVKKFMVYKGENYLIELYEYY